MIPPVVDQGWLAAHPDAIVADVRHYLDGRSGRDAYAAGTLPEFEVVHTVIRGHEADVPAVAAAAEGVDLVLQQGVWGREPPLNLAEFQTLADSLARPVRIRTKEIGEVLYQDGVFTVAGSMTVTDPKRLQAYYKGGVRRGD